MHVIDDTGWFDRLGRITVPALLFADPSICGGAKTLYALLLAAVQIGADLPPDALGRAVDVADRTTKKYLRDLEKAGLISVEDGEIRILPPVVLCGSPYARFADALGVGNHYQPQPVMGGTIGGANQPPDHPAESTPDPSTAPRSQPQESSEQAGAARTKKEKSANETKQFIAWVCDTVKERTGETFRVTPQQAGLAKNLVKHYGLEKLRRLAVECMADPWVQDKGFDITMLNTMANRIAQRLAKDHYKAKSAKDQKIDLWEKHVLSCRRCNGAGRRGCECREAYMIACREANLT